jgi:hypothetical protein
MSNIENGKIVQIGELDFDSATKRYTNFLSKIEITPNRISEIVKAASGNPDQFIRAVSHIPKSFDSLREIGEDL